MIKVEKLTKKYGKNLAVNNISFYIPAGEIVGILGPNGAGKSTLMNMLTGYISSSYGEINIGGYDLLENPVEAKKCIGYLPEIPPLYLDMTIEEYLDFVCDVKDVKTDRKNILNYLCDTLQISDVKKRVIKNLSKGYRQRVGLAAALIGDPEILILDEPTAGLDPIEIVEIRNLIKQFGKTKTVLISSHILAEIQATCDRVIIFNKGEILLDADIDSISAKVGANSRYLVRLAAPEEEVVDVLSLLEGISHIESRGSVESGTVDIVVEAEENTDIRKLLFDECAKRNWYILMINPIGADLEDIFLQIVEKTTPMALTSNEEETEDDGDN